jgi:6-phosphogluconate dehydrogenase
MKQKCDIGLIGLAVMGRNLVLNMADRGFDVAVYNRTISRMDEFVKNEAAGKTVRGVHSIQELTALLEKPRKVMLMVQAGPAVDECIKELLKYLEPGDCIIDAGNSHFEDTMRRTQWCRDKGMLFVGMGVSGGEKGARFGPSMMPGGTPEAWPLVKNIFRSICAKSPDGHPCCEWIGKNGAGHFVKMTHNGIEYCDMQIIAEAYQLMRDGLGMSAEQMHGVFAEWNRGELNSYLIEITAEVLAYKDKDGAPLVDKILDVSGQKGTGKWTIVSSLDLNVPATLMAEAVFSRNLSVLKEQRRRASQTFKSANICTVFDAKTCVNDIGQALLASKIICYSQGFMIMQEASRKYAWGLDYASISLLWRAGCIIRSVFLDRIKESFNKDRALENLMFAEYFKTTLRRCQESWRRAVSLAVSLGIPVPALSGALAFFDGFRCENSAANLIQAQRDFFGSHTYQRKDKPESQFFHTDWTGTGLETPV